MAHIVHVIQGLSRGGGARATMYLAKYSALHGGHTHTIVSLTPPDPEAVTLAHADKISVVHSVPDTVLSEVLANADIVQYSWWNNVEMQQLFRKTLPPMRTVGWFHVGGTAAPQVVTPKLLDYFDYAVACSPYTYKAAAFQTLSAREREARTTMVYGATDFARLMDYKPLPHRGFVVGYIGTLDFLKMHRQYVAMNAKANIPDVKFMFCGSGEAVPAILAEASAMGKADQYEYLGYVENIKDFLSIMDVYGYPLCKETYAASEMNLQEVMFAGIPPVVFPHGGIQDLVIHNQTGIIVHSEEEYSQALEYLYNNPTERARLGQGARTYAAREFGADNAGRAINKVYDKVLQLPKRVPVWGGTDTERHSGRVRVGIDDLYFGSDDRIGHKAFIESLGFQAEVFLQSAYGRSDLEKLEADLQIYHCSSVLHRSGIAPYKNSYPSDPYLQYWDGLANLGVGNLSDAVIALVEASKTFQEWRLFFFLSIAAKEFGQQQLWEQATSICQQLRSANAHLEVAHEVDATLRKFLR